MSLAQRNEDADAELLSAKARIVTQLDAWIGPVTFFEHGAASRAETAGACVDHAHLHAVPKALRLADSFLRDFGQVKDFGSHIEALNELKDAPYVYCEEPTGAIYGALANQCDSQYLRREASLRLGALNRANWRDCFRLIDQLGIRFELLEALAQLAD
jgi:hypothetical protein